MLGVKIYLNYNETKRENGKILVKSVKEIMNRRIFGKFMACTDKSSCIKIFATKLQTFEIKKVALIKLPRPTIHGFFKTYCLNLKKK